MKRFSASMLKSIKISLNSVLIAAGALLLLIISLFAILRIPAVQTYLINGVSEYIAADIKSTVTVSRINFSFFNRLSVNDLLVKDYRNDTLIYAERISAVLRRLDRKKGIISLGRVIADKPYLAVVTDSAGTTNLTWYIDFLKGEKDTASARNTKFSIGRIDLRNGKFRLKNLAAEKSKTPVNFSDLRIDSIFSVVDMLEVSGDTTAIGISSLAFTESTGFRLKEMFTDLKLGGSSILFSNSMLLTDRSEINADRIFLLADTSTAFRNFISEVRLKVNLRNSTIHSEDLKFFVPTLKGFNDSFIIDGNISGTVAELKGRKVKMKYKDETLLDFDFDLSGLPDIPNTFIFVEVNDFRSISHDIEKLNIPGRGPILIPEPLRKLGVVSFSGTFTGFTKDFVTYGKINTNKGVLSTDISMRPEENNRFRLRGFLKGNSLDLRSVVGEKSQLGFMTVQANVDGFTEGFKKFTLNVNGVIDSVEFRDYTYRKIELNGLFNNNSWDGNIKIEDRHINMELLGMLNFSTNVPEFDFTLNLRKADLFSLNLATKDSSAGASLLLTANFSGNNIDNLDGEIKLLNSSFTKWGQNLEIYDFSLRTFVANNAPSISLRTDFIDATLSGHYNLSSLSVLAKIAMADLFPSKFKIPEKLFKPHDNNFSYEVKFKNTDRLNKFLQTGITLAPNSFISGRVFEDSLFTLTARAKQFSVNSISFRDLNLDAGYKSKTGTARISASNLDLAGISEFRDFGVDLSARKDSFNVSGMWDNHDKISNRGAFQATGRFFLPEGRENSPKFELLLAPGEVYVRNDRWDINGARLTADSSSMKIEGFRIGSGDNHFEVHGAVSDSPSDTLYLGFRGISLKPVNNLYEKKMNYDPLMIRLAIGGIVNGNISITNVYRNFMFESNITVNDFTLLESRYGDIHIKSAWNNARQVADINAGNDFEGRKMFTIAGTYDPAIKNADLGITTDLMPLEVLNPLLKSFASGITGAATGKVRFTGELNKPVITGSLWAENASFRIDYLQTKYRFSDSIRFDSRGIGFRNIQVKDERNNTAAFSGMVYHKYFKDFAVDLNIRTNETMVLNTKPKDNELFYGTAYASGVTTIKSSGNILGFEISAKTGRNTRFFIPLNSGMSISESKFITFISRDSTGGAREVTGPAQDVPKASGMELEFDLEVTPDAELQLIMDPKAGDIMKGKGAGNLNISLDRKGIFKIYGDYTIANGDYLFTLGNIINKPFSVENGGRINFNGDVENADVDIKAIYKTKAALYDIMPGIPDPKLKERIPVECHLLLTGKLFNPVVGFDIYLPTADEETRAYLKSMIKSDEEMSRQFLFLLVMNSFYADPQAGTSSSTAAMGSATMGVTTMEMFSNQISNWLSQISNDVDIGVNYRPGTSSLQNSDELQVALSTQLLNDRVTINGNFDMAATGSGKNDPVNLNRTNQFTGEFDIEYKIKKDNDKLRFKFFNRSNDNFYIDNGVQYTQGIGLYFRQDFNRLRDLFRREKKSEMKKEEETKPEKVNK